MQLPIIESERIKRRMSRDDLATCLSVSKRTIQNWQNGSTEIPLSKIKILMEQWSCSADYLLGIESNNHDQSGA